MIYMSKAINVSYLVYLKTFEICVIKYRHLTQAVFTTHGLAWQAALKKQM